MIKNVLVGGTKIQEVIYDKNKLYVESFKTECLEKTGKSKKENFLWLVVTKTFIWELVISIEVLFLMVYLNSKTLIYIFNNYLQNDLVILFVSIIIITLLIILQIYFFIFIFSNYFQFSIGLKNRQILDKFFEKKE